MGAYPQEYLNDVVENQGKLFDYVAQAYPDMDTGDFIDAYMTGKTRKSIDEAQAYVSTMSAEELWDYFSETEHYKLKPGKALTGFAPDWIGAIRYPKRRGGQQGAAGLPEKGLRRPSRPEP